MTTESLELKAKKIVSAQPLEVLIESFEITNENIKNAIGNDDEYLAIAEMRGWIADELDNRNPIAFEKWIESNEESPRKFFITKSKETVV